jgi:hypothetical protein
MRAVAVLASWTGWGRAECLALTPEELVAWLEALPVRRFRGFIG